MCHKHEMMEHFYSKVGRTHRSVNPTRRAGSIPTEILPPNDVVMSYDDDILEEGKIYTR